ncbi:MAG TPA: hypothetical protein VG406_12680 [Isosphaeraceae bacterium]|nr:hypothetical protein [Isosphaeraceae bacterium]
MRLDYQAYPAPWAPGGLVYRPVVDLQIYGPTGQFSSSALADTGSDVTLVTDLVAPTLGVALGPEEMIRGIAGQQLPVRFGEVELELRGPAEVFQWRARVAFYPGMIDFLGHDGFFDLFHAGFDNHRRALTIRPHRGVAVLRRPLP